MSLVPEPPRENNEKLTGNLAEDVPKALKVIHNQAPLALPYRVVDGAVFGKET